MQWKRGGAGQAWDNVLICTETDPPAIAAHLAALVDQMESDWQARGKPPESALLIDVNCTNGHLMLMWRDGEDGGDPEYAYYLELRRLWFVAEDHDDGLDHFNRVANVAICTLAEEFLSTVYDEASAEWSESERFQLYVLFEGSGSVTRVRV